jgi:hypothetical protein
MIDSDFVIPRLIMIHLRRITYFLLGIAVKTHIHPHILDIFAHKVL